MTVRFYVRWFKSLESLSKFEYYNKSYFRSLTPLLVEAGTELNFSNRSCRFFKSSWEAFELRGAENIELFFYPVTSGCLTIYVLTWVLTGDLSWVYYKKLIVFED